MATVWCRLRVIYKNDREFEWPLETEDLVREVQSKISDAMDADLGASVVTFYDHDGDFVALNASEILYAVTVKKKENIHYVS